LFNLTFIKAVKHCKKQIPKERVMKKVFTALVVVAALAAGTVSFAGPGPRTGGGRTDMTTSSLDCQTMTTSALECEVLSSLQ
jgi:hypothetical protein